MLGVVAGGDTVLAMLLKNGFLDSSGRLVFTAAAGGLVTGGCAEGVGGAGAGGTASSRDSS